MTPFAFAVEALATYRLTKLVVDDTLTAELRDGVIEAAYRAEGTYDSHVPDSDHPGAWVEVVAQCSDPPKLAFLVTCPWCAGMWVSIGVLLLRLVAPKAWARLAEVLALSAVAGLVAENWQES